MFLSLHVHHGAEKMVSFSRLCIYSLRVCDRQIDRQMRAEKERKKRKRANKIFLGAFV